MNPPPLELEEAQARLLALAEPLGIERMPVVEALGRYLAEPLLARRTQPPADLSAMDGYAVRADDLHGPWQLVGESACGHPYLDDALAAPGKAIRISTGALMPPHADAVVVQEDCEVDNGQVRLTGEGPNPPTKHIRPKGNDFTTGQQLLEAGTRIGPAQIALALTGGHRMIGVRRKVRLAVLDTGDELAADPERCALHQIPASNGAMLAAMVAGLPCDVSQGAPVPDWLDALIKTFAAHAHADLIVTSGGASVGDHDLLRPALEQWGAEIDFWRVAIRPGKPLMVARKGKTIVLGLPGNPVSSNVTAFLFMLPLIRALSGAAAPLPTPFRTVLAQNLPQGGPRREFVRGRWDGAAVTPLRNQDSGALFTLAGSNALIERAAGAPAASAGSPVSAYLLENGGIA